MWTYLGGGGLVGLEKRSGVTISRDTSSHSDLELDKILLP